MYSYNNNLTQNIYVFKNPSRQLWGPVGFLIPGTITLFLVLGSIGMILRLIFDSSSRAEIEPHPVLIMFVITLVMVYRTTRGALRYRAEWEGTELNLINRTMTFPGGRRPAKDVSDYFDLKFLFQDCFRTTVDLDAISEIKRHSSNLEFIGTFGAAYLSFDDKGISDELFNAIRLANRMGTPIFKVSGNGNLTNTNIGYRGTANANSSPPRAVVGTRPVAPSAGNRPTSARSLFKKRP